MKPTKIILLLALLPFALAGQIPNNSFENWLPYLNENPDIWMSSNTFWYGSNTVVKETPAFSGSYSIKLETKDLGYDTVPGLLLIGTPGNQTVNGGYPYAERPDSFAGAVKYNIAANDTAALYVFFKKNSAIAGSVMFRFTGSQPSWQSFKMPITWLIPDSVNPDTIAAIISSSNLDYAKIPGSYLSLDGFGFTGASAPFPNGDFEDWMTTSWDEPADGWQSLNSFTVPYGQISASKDTDSYDGNYAVRIQSLPLPAMGNQTAGFVFLGQWTSDGPGGGIPFTDVPTKLTGYYKYFPVTDDTASVIVKFNNDSTLQFNALLNAASSYTYFEVPISLMTAPDTVLIGLVANKMGAPVSPGSVFIVDDLNFVILVGNKEIEYPLLAETAIFPNPSNGIFSVRRELIHDENVTITIIDVNGKEIKNINYGAQTKGVHSFAVDMAGISPGVYYITTEHLRKLLGKVMVLRTIK